MPRLLVALSVIGFCIWVYTLVDVIRTNESRARGLPKPFWVVIVIALPLIGSILWFAIGKERKGGAARPQTRQVAPDDDPGFLRGLGSDLEREERIRKLEEKLAELDDDNPKD